MECGATVATRAIALEGLHEAFGARKSLGRRLRIGDREADDRLAQHARMPAPRGLRDFLLEVYMSVCSVVPDCSISSAARRVPTRTISGDTVFPSAGKMYFWSQSISTRSSARPRT